MTLVVILILLGLPFAIGALATIWLRKFQLRLRRRWRVWLAALCSGIPLAIFAAVIWVRESEDPLGFAIMVIMQIIMVGLPAALWFSRGEKRPEQSAKVFD